MIFTRRVFPLLLLVLSVLGVSCTDAPRTEGPRGAGGVSAAAADAEKVLIPHKSWTCGMPEGIVKPENGTLVFEAEMKLDQIYNVGKTPFGQRRVLVVQG